MGKNLDIAFGGSFYLSKHYSHCQRLGKGYSIVAMPSIERLIKIRKESYRIKPIVKA